MWQFEILEPCFYSFLMEVSGRDQEKRTGTHILAHHKPSTEGDCTSRPGCELQEHPFCCSWHKYEAEIKGSSTFCGCKQIHHRPSVKGHKLLSARDTFQSRRGCPWQWHTAALCHINFSCSSLWFLSCFSVEGFFRGGGGKAHRILIKEIKVFYSICTFATEKLFFFNLDVPWYTWPKFFSAVPTFCERLEVTPKRVKFWKWNMKIDKPVHELQCLFSEN